MASAASAAVGTAPVSRGFPLSASTLTRTADLPISTFHFTGVGGAASSLAAAQQHRFKADFRSEIARLSAWLNEHGWPASSPSELQVVVSDDLRMSKSLVPAWLGRQGRMEFPAWRVSAGEAAILHELVHVYCPNGNRLLAEGLAVYLHTRIGGNPAFPNFGVPLHQAAHEGLSEMVPGLDWDDPKALEPIHVAELDTIATPDALMLGIGPERHGKTPHEQARLYCIAGSFVAFLIEAHGMDKLRRLFMRTPLIPLKRAPGSPERWIECYGQSLAPLEQHWKSLILASAPRPACRGRAASGDRRTAARSPSRLSKKAHPRVWTEERRST
jgi:hypothetical protein